MPHQHVHNLTPYPHSAEGSAFPFPTIPAKQSPMQLQPQRTPSSSSSTSSSYASFRYPTPHAQSYPSASFPLKLSTIHSPVPPSLLQRRRSSCCTVSSMDSLASASTTSTSSWGNWSVDSPVPGLSRSGSSSSRTGAEVGEDLKTPETVLFGDFEDEISHKLNAEQRREEQEEEEDFALSHSHSGLVSAMKTKKSTMARPRLFVKLAEPEQKTGPRLQRTQTPLELWTMRSQRSAPVQEEEMEMKEEDITSIKAITRATKVTSTTTPTRPKLERKLTPHPATGPASTQHLKGAFPSSSSASDFAFEGLVLEEVDEDEQAESSEEKAEDEEEEEKSTRPSSLWDISLPPATRGRPIHRMALGRRFSSVIEEGKVWLAV